MNTVKELSLQVTNPDGEVRTIKTRNDLIDGLVVEVVEVRDSTGNGPLLHPPMTVYNLEQAASWAEYKEQPEWKAYWEEILSKVR